MIETRPTWRWLLVGAGIGIVAGAVIGLLLGWAFPISSGGSLDLSALKPEEQNNYIVLVANSYAFDGDLALARQRLAGLHDSNIKARVERLAKSLQAKKDPSAANVADLAVALGSSDSALKVLEASVSRAAGGEPTKVARAEIEPSPTPKPTVAPTNTLPATATLAPTLAPTATLARVQSSAPRNTPKPAATNPPSPAAVLYPEFHPDFPSLWWDSQFIPASVAAGQQYWRLKYALYCDWKDNRNNCQSLPSGENGTTIYVMALNPSGACADNPTIHFDINDGSVMRLAAEEAKDIPYPWYNSPCRTDWEKGMYGEGNTVSVEGLPSDRITGLTLCSKFQVTGENPPPCGHAHVRYFLVFQQTAR